jgi:type I restriction enzyme S subunit
MSGNAITRLTLIKIKNLIVPVPPLAEQKRIAEILDTADQAIHSTELLTAKLEQAKQGFLRDLLTCGIDASGRIRDPRSARDSFVDTQLGPLPSSWTVQPVEALLADVTPAMRSGPFGSALLKSELVEDGIPMLGIDNVETERFVQSYSRFVSQEKYRELARYVVRPRDVMVTIMGTVGRCCVVPENIGCALSSKHVWALTFDSHKYLPELVCLQVNYSNWVLRHFARDTQGGIMSAIRSDTLKTTLLPVPPINEQRRIWEVLQTVQTRIDAARREATKLRLLKQGLMDDLLTGRVRVGASA